MGKIAVEADVKADVLKTIASGFDPQTRGKRFYICDDFKARAISRDLCASEFMDHEEPAILLDIYRILGLEKDEKPLFRVRIDVTITRTEEKK